MPWVKTDTGMVHLRISGKRKLNLCSCRAFATLQCDWPKEGGGTCDKPICRSCARADGPEKDYCPFHRGAPPITEAEGIAAGEAEARKLADMFGVKR